MNHKKFTVYSGIGFLVVGLAGFLIHNLYELSENNRLVGLFTPVNESTWEHMKLAFFPMLLFVLVMNLIMRKREMYSCTNVALLSTPIVFSWTIPFLFYTYRGIVGKGAMWADILTYYVGLVITWVWLLHASKRMGNKKSVELLWTMVGLLCVMFLAFLTFTYKPLSLGIFISPK